MDERASSAPIDTEVGVVIVAYNSAPYLPAVFEALARQTFRNFAVVVIDNASRPDARPDPACLPSNARLLQMEENLGFAAGNNRAARSFNAPFLAFLNPDAFPEPDWLERLLAAAQRWPRAAAFGSTQINAENRGLLDGLGDVMHASGLCYRSGYGKPAVGPYPEGETFSACAAAMLVRADKFWEIGGFDERFFCFVEDVDLGFRLRLMGSAIIQVGDARVRHIGGGSTGKRSAFADYHGARNRLWAFVKNMPGPLLWPLLPAHLAMSALTLAAWTVQGRGLHGWRGLAAAIAGLSPVLEDRRRLQRDKRATVQDIARALSWSPSAPLRRAPVIRSPRR